MWKLKKWDDQYGIRPDAEGMLENGQRLLIEFYFSHRVDGKKRDIIASNKLLCIEIDINYEELDRSELKRFLVESSDFRKWVMPGNRNQEVCNSGGYHRNPLYDRARDRLKVLFDEGTFNIGGTSEFNGKVYNLRSLGYDVCEVNARYNGFKTDLLMYRSQSENKGYIAVCIRGRIRTEPFKRPKQLRIIDVVLSSMFPLNLVESCVKHGGRPYDVGMVYWNFNPRR